MSWPSPTHRYGIALAAVVLLTVMAPFGPALQVHHQLAGADRDGHQHGDFDLCQWVQHHGTSAPALPVLDLGRPCARPVGRTELSVLLLRNGEREAHPSPRGPPLS